MDDDVSLMPYLNLMEEAKSRALAINTLLGMKASMPEAYLRECCFLQLRMLCEVIALGCLVAHDDVVAKRGSRLLKRYEPGAIFKEVEQLHPDFYPIPCAFERTEAGIHLGDYEKPFLRQSELTKLWEQAGSLLHRGSLKKFRSDSKKQELGFSDIVTWGQKALNLLSVHRIAHRGAQSGLIVLLHVDDLNGAVQVLKYGRHEA